MKNKRYKILGEGDDLVENWESPISEYPIILEVINYCEENEIIFPESLLFEFLKGCRLNFRPSKGDVATTNEEFLIKLLNPWLKIDYEQWGGDSPGLSGSYVVVKMELGNTKDIRQILFKSSEFLSEWMGKTDAKECQKGSLDHPTHSASSIYDQEFAEAMKVKLKLNRQMRSKISEDSSHMHFKDRPTVPQKHIGLASDRIKLQFEKEMFEYVAAAVDNDKTVVKLNYFVFQRVIFFIPWIWFSLPGSSETILLMLRNAGYMVVECHIKASKHRGNIPHWGRGGGNLGWNERGIEITVPDKWKDLLSEAREANRK